MELEKIKELVSIKNKEIENQINDIKKTYKINVTNELLEQLVVYSLEAIKYYNKKYSYFTGDEYEQLFVFADEVYNTTIYKYNLLNSANYKNNNYIEFLNLFQNGHTLDTISFIFNIIQIQIEILKNKNIYFEYKCRKIDESKLHVGDEIKVNLPTNESILFLVYYYLNKDKNNKIEAIKENIEENINLLKFGRCNLFEDIYFNFENYYETTNMKSEYFLEILEQNDENYNLTLHQNTLNVIREMF